MSVPIMGHITAFLPCAFHALPSTDRNMHESHQKLEEEPGVLEDCFSHHSSADHHLQGKLLMEMLDDKHTKKHYSHVMTACEGKCFVFQHLFSFLPIVIAC